MLGFGDGVVAMAYKGMACSFLADGVTAMAAHSHGLLGFDVGIIVIADEVSNGL